METNKQSLCKSFKSAFRGLKYAIKEERNFVIQIGIGIFAVFFAFILKLSQSEKTIIIILTGVVLGGELINSVVERMLNLITTNYSSKIAKIKDLSAGAVLISSLTALVIGLIIFIKAIFFN